MKKLSFAIMSVVFGALVSCVPTGIQITSLETKYGTIATNADGSQSFTTKPSDDAPVVVGTVITSEGSVTVNPDGSYTFKSNPPEAIAATLEGEEVPVVLGDK